MRSSWGTNVGLDLSVVFCTNSTIACLAGPSFHEGSGSLCAALCAPATVIKRRKVVAKASRCLRNVRREDLITFFLYGLYGLADLTVTTSNPQRARATKRSTGLHST